MRRLRAWVGLSGLVALAASPTGGPRVFVLDAKESLLAIQVGKAGLFKFAGHEHRVLAPGIEGQVLVDRGSLAASTVRLSVDARAMSVSPEGEPPEDVPKVQQKMLSAEVLDVARFPLVTFESRFVTGSEGGRGVYDLKVTGDLSLHGVTRSVVVPVRVEISEDALTATGAVKVKQSDFGIHPVSVAGVVNVKDELGVQLKLVAHARPAAVE